MEWWLVLICILGSLIVLMATGMPVAFCFLLVNMIGVYLLMGGEAGLRIIALSMFESVALFTLVAVVMFMLMGQIMFHSGMAINMIDTLDKLLGRMPGRLGVLAVAGGTLMATLSGASMATTAVLGSQLVPEMERRGYKKPMSLGPILGSGGLSIMIPPSGQAVILSALAGISVAGVLIGGIVPGVLMAFFYSGYIVLRCWLQPSIAPSYKVVSIPISEKLITTVKYVLPLGFIVFMVIGIIFLGVATPSEAAATGVAGTLILVACYKKLNRQVIKKSLWSTLRTVIMVLFIFAASKTFSELMAFSGASRGLVGWIASLQISPIQVVIGMMVTILVLGMFMSTVTIMMISLPIFMPVINNMDFNPIWFGLLVLLAVEMSVTSPPFGLTLFVMKGVAPADTTMGDVYRSALPFLGCDLIVMALIIAFPAMPLWLPSLMRG